MYTTIKQNTKSYMEVVSLILDSSKSNVHKVTVEHLPTHTICTCTCKVLIISFHYYWLTMSSLRSYTRKEYVAFQLSLPVGNCT